MSQPLISVCLPTFNGERFIASAIESVLAQTHQNLELVITDDGSSDTSVEIAKKYQAMDARVKLHSNSERLRAVLNYNKAVQLSSGEFVKLFAQDDLLEPTNLERCVNALSANEALSFVTTAKLWIDENGAPLDLPQIQAKSLSQHFDRDTRFGYSEALKSCSSSLVNWIGSPSTIMLRRARFKNGFNPKYDQLMDLEFFLRLLQEDDAIYLSEQLSQFRLHQQCQSSLNEHNPQTCLEWLILAAEHAEDLPAVGFQFHQFCQWFLEAYAGWAKNSPEMETRFEQFNRSLTHPISDLQLASLLLSSGTLQAARLLKNLKNTDRLRNDLAVAQSHVASLENALETRAQATEELRLRKNARIAQLEKSLEEATVLIGKLQNECELHARAQSEFKELESAYRKEFESLYQSRSWKITAPIRFINKHFVSQVKNTSAVDTIRQSLRSDKS
jgi:glycosyltransferase involved in cell wall biosynthesis